MIIQIDQLFINTDNIVTISPYDKLVTSKEDESKKFVETGFIINGVPYALFAISIDDEKAIVEFKQKVVNIVTTIINSISVHPVQKLNIAEESKKDAE